MNQMNPEGVLDIVANWDTTQMKTPKGFRYCHFYSATRSGLMGFDLMHLQQYLNLFEVDLPLHIVLVAIAQSLLPYHHFCVINLLSVL